MRPRIAIATSMRGLERDPDLEPLHAALAAGGAEPRITVWDDPSVDWSGFHATVVRSTWDYALQRSAFLDWAATVERAGPIWNPVPLLTWSTDKRYLFELRSAGIPVVPTRLVVPGDDPALPELESGRPEDEIVVKPAVSAGARDTDRYLAERAVEALAHVRRLLDHGRSVLVQPYLSSVDDRGERALVFVEGAFSHAVTKAPILRPDVDPDRPAADVLADLFTGEQITAVAPSAAEHAVAEAALSYTADRFGVPLYGRVDLVDGPDGPYVLELELAEPSLFHAHGPGSVDRLADALLARLG
ncbi:MAG: hypothetical protein MUE34_02480 [Acidimicrobiales bacterium]|jgi:O-ureido-D-serine cyclo-ligase|nr:hypothetical protein [Acidimicrobiales bacterium]